jgi:hypothetical protein
MTKQHHHHIWVIVILVLAIVVAHSAPVIVNEFYTEKTDEPFTVPLPLPVKNIISTKEKKGRKYSNVFEGNTCVNGNTGTEQENITTDPIHSASLCRLGSDELNYSVIQNDSKFDIQNDHLLYFVKAENNHHIKTGKLELSHNFDGVIKEAKSIWYLFDNQDWDFSNKWIFKDSKNSYYAPENNTIIEFEKSETYELSPLVSEESKYFTVIINF